MRTVCPSLATLQAYSLGTLSAAETAELDRHLDQCQPCVTWLLERGDSEDALVEAMRSAPDSAPFAEELSCRQGLARAMELGALFGHSVPTTGPTATAEPSVESSRLHELRDYELGEMLGRGGMGTVYRARHRKLDRIVAIKLINTHLEGGSPRIARFEQEMRAAGQLDHPNIVRATDAGEVDGIPYLAMEFVDGMDLAQWVERHGPLRSANACEIIVQAAHGLQHAHEHGLVHRDIKPANLMLTVDGRVKVLDLGIALLRGHELREATDDAVGGRPTLMGTVSFMAPEQFDELATSDIRTDIYSLGGTLFFLLTGQTPWNVEHNQTWNTRPVPWPEAITSRLQADQRDIPAELISVILRMLAPEPSERFARPCDVIEALRAFTHHADLAAMMCDATSSPDKVHGSGPKQVTRPDKQVSGAATRPRGFAALLMTACVVLGLVAVLVAYVVRSPSSSAKIADRSRAMDPSAADTDSVQSAIVEERNPTRQADWRSATGLPILSLSVASSGNLVATADESGVIQLCDRWTGEPRRALRGHEGPVWGLAFSDHGERLLSGGDDQTVRIWNVATGTLTRQLTGHTGPVLAVTWSPDETYAASAGCDARIILWNAEDGTRHLLDGYSDLDDVPTPRQLEDLQALRGHITWIRTLAFAPRGDCLTSGGNEALIATWDLATGAIIQRYVGHTAPVTMVKYTSDGQRLISAGYDDRLRVWDTHDGRLLATLEGHSGPVRQFDVSADDQLLVSASADTTVRLWNLVEGQERCCFRGHLQCVNAVCFTPDGDTIVSVSDDATVRIWQVDRTNLRR